MQLTAALDSAVRDLGQDFNRVLATTDGMAYPSIVTGVWLRHKQHARLPGAVGRRRRQWQRVPDAGRSRNIRRRRISGVAARTRELAVRVAPGASRRRVLGMILFDVLKLATPGVAVGLVITAAFIRLSGDKAGISISNAEPLADVVGAAIAGLVAVLASRAASVQPMVAPDRYRIATALIIVA